MAVVKTDPDEQAMGDLLWISNSDHPGMTLRSRLFNGNNYIAWSKSVRMGLDAKLKLGFINRSCKKPTDNTNLAQKGTRCDYMVRCWLMNSLSPEIVECFTSSKSAKELWDELCEHFGEANGPLLYQLHRELHLMTQENGVSCIYFSRLKKYWDEITSIDGVLECSCGAMAVCKCDKCDLAKKLQERNKLLQFLMG